MLCCMLCCMLCATACCVRWRMAAFASMPRTLSHCFASCRDSYACKALQVAMQCPTASRQSGAPRAVVGSHARHAISINRPRVPFWGLQARGSSAAAQRSRTSCAGLFGGSATVAYTSAPVSEPEVLSCTQYDAGVSVVVGRADGALLVVVMADKPRPDLLLHWGVNDWQLPPKLVWPAGTSKAGEGAVQSEFQGGQSVALAFPESECPSKLVFVLKEGDEWINEDGSDFTIDLSSLVGAPALVPSRSPSGATAYSRSPSPEPRSPSVSGRKPGVVSSVHYTEAGIHVEVKKEKGAYQVDITADEPRPDLLLHWGIGDWQLPPKALCPEGTVQSGDGSVQSHFGGGKFIRLTFPEAWCPSKLVFVLKEGERWINHQGGDFSVDLKPRGLEATAALRQPEVLSFRQYEAGINIAVGKADGAYLVDVTSDQPRPGLVLHWGINHWQLPPKALWPSGTVQAGEGSLETPFRGGKSVTLAFAESLCPSQLVFVLREGQEWIKDGVEDFTAELKPVRVVEEAQAAQPAHLSNRAPAHAAPAVRAARAQPMRMPIPDVPEPEVLNTIKLDDGISLIMGRADGFVLVVAMCDRTRPGLVMHWGVDDWQVPEEVVWPTGTKELESALESPFQDGQSVTIAFPEARCPSKLVFVLREGESWINNQGGDFTASLAPQGAPAAHAASSARGHQPAPSPEAQPRSSFDSGFFGGKANQRTDLVFQ